MTYDCGPISSRKRALVCGAGGFIGAHLVKKLRRQGYWVRGVDLEYPPYADTEADEFIVGDLAIRDVCETVLDDTIHEVYQLAADMGGIGFIDSAETTIMTNSALINSNMINVAAARNVSRYFFSSSACVYADQELGSRWISEEEVYPANPDNEYGWEKLYAERMALAFARNRGLEVRIARFQNCYGPETTWDGGREKAPAALCRKIAMLPEEGGEIEVWGEGNAERNFIYVDDLCDGIYTLTQNDTFKEPVNIGTTEIVTVNELIEMIATVAGKKVTRKHIPGPVGVLGRYQKVDRIKSLGWHPEWIMKDGMKETYLWIEKQVNYKEQFEIQ
jgi:nucleoside-diphosphate-sugar epimerase